MSPVWWIVTAFMPWRWLVGSAAGFPMPTSRTFGGPLLRADGQGRGQDRAGAALRSESRRPRGLGRGVALFPDPR